MSLSPHVFDATADNFSRLVLENSRRGLVLVHSWTPRAGPCMVLMPRLVKLAAVMLARGRMEAALDLLLALFDLLGADHPLARACRTRLAQQHE